MIIEPPESPNTTHFVVGLDRCEALELLAATTLGRVIYTADSLPTVRLVNHLVEQDVIIVRTRLTGEFGGGVRAASDLVVAYQADEVDPARHTGWSVVVTGFARTVTDAARTDRYRELWWPLAPDVDCFIAIEPVLITGIRLVEKR